MFGKQYHFCPNCGTRLYDSNLTDRITAAMCSIACLREWELKYARCILGQDAEERQ